MYLYCWQMIKLSLLYNKIPSFKKDAKISILENYYVLAIIIPPNNFFELYQFRTKNVRKIYFGYMQVLLFLA
jgi:hypothetical protein